MLQHLRPIKEAEGEQYRLRQKCCYSMATLHLNRSRQDECLIFEQKSRWPPYPWKEANKIDALPLHRSQDGCLTLEKKPIRWMSYLWTEAKMAAYLWKEANKMDALRMNIEQKSYGHLTFEKKPRWLPYFWTDAKRAALPLIKSQQDGCLTFEKKPIRWLPSVSFLTRM